MPWYVILSGKIHDDFDLNPTIHYYPRPSEDRLDFVVSSVLSIKYCLVFTIAIPFWDDPGRDNAHRWLNERYSKISDFYHPFQKADNITEEINVAIIMGLIYPGSKMGIREGFGSSTGSSDASRVSNIILVETSDWSVYRLTVRLSIKRLIFWGSFRWNDPMGWHSNCFKHHWKHKMGLKICSSTSYFGVWSLTFSLTFP